MSVTLRNTCSIVHVSAKHCSVLDINVIQGKVRQCSTQSSGLFHRRCLEWAAWLLLYTVYLLCHTSWTKIYSLTPPVLWSSLQVQSSGTTLKKLSAVREALSRKGKVSGRPSRKTSAGNPHATCLKLLDKLLNSFS